MYLTKILIYVVLGAMPLLYMTQIDLYVFMGMTLLWYLRGMISRKWSGASTLSTTARLTQMMVNILTYHRRKWNMWRGRGPRREILQWPAKEGLMKEKMINHNSVWPDVVFNVVRSREFEPWHMRKLAQVK